MKILFQILLLLLFHCSLLAQSSSLDSSGLKIIQIVHVDSLLGTNGEGNNFQRLLGSVVIEHDSVHMTCDSAHFYQDQNTIEAFSNVVISKANGATATSDYIKYTGSNNTAFMKGNAQIMDDGKTLTTDELTYNIKTKIGSYNKGGTLQTDSTTVTSEIGNYNGYTQQTYFKNNVVVTNPKYNIESKELTYNIKSKIVKLLDESTVLTENSTIYTKGGTYDSKNESAIFDKRSTVENENQIITGNTLTYNEKTGQAVAIGNVIIIDTVKGSKITADKTEYNKISGYGKAIGHVHIDQDSGKTQLTANELEYNKKTGYVKALGRVILLDTVQKTTLLAGVVESNEYTKFMLATEFPKLISIADGDTLYMRADTMMSVRVKDVMIIKKVPSEINKKNKTRTYTYNLLIADSSFASENEQEPKLIIANRHVRLFSDSLQAVCDSFSYTQSDSMFRLYRNPIIWSKNQQTNADTIYMHTKDNKLSELNLLHDALLISSTGYATMYDQIAGSLIDAYFIQNEIQFVHVNQNAESIYYAKDEGGAYIGANKAEGAEIKIYFEDKAIRRLVILNDPKGVMYPMDKLPDDQKYLANFKILTDKKPKSKAEILED